MNSASTTASQSVSSSTATSVFPFPGIRTAKPDGPVTATVRPTPPISIPYQISSYASNSPFDDPVWTIPPIPVSATNTTTETTAGKIEKSSASTSITSTTEPLLKSVFPPMCSSSDSATPASQRSEPDVSQSVPLPPPFLPPPPPPPSTSHGPWSPNIFRPVPITTSTLPTFTDQQPLTDSAFHTPPPALAPTVPIVKPLSVVRRPSQPPPPQPVFPSPQLPCVLPPPPLAYITDVSTPSASTQSTTISNAGSDAANKDIFPSPPIADIEAVSLVRSDAATTAPVRDLLEPSVKSVVCAQPMPMKPPPPPAPGLSPGGISRVSSGSGNSIREAVLCSACGQMHDPYQAHVYDYSEPVDADLLCRICRQPLVDPLDTKCGHTFCTPCLKSHLVVQALCPEDKQIINYLECQQSSNLVKRHRAVTVASVLLLATWAGQSGVFVLAACSAAALLPPRWCDSVPMYAERVLKSGPPAAEC
ncbi:unnamed protein product [Schistocephalus solidus]|uniref:RING-type domain-containing protein n=1 Tax=Schistocephalus solidus TaxID=70667 RepID=A0A183SPG3_SCHSO|nr:unnamed protein product [Schistocephalus solidus]